MEVDLTHEVDDVHQLDVVDDDSDMRLAQLELEQLAVVVDLAVEVRLLPLVDRRGDSTSEFRPQLCAWSMLMLMLTLCSMRSFERCASPNGESPRGENGESPPNGRSWVEVLEVQTENT